MFTVKTQEFTDKNTGVTIAFGEHAPGQTGSGSGSAPGEARGTSWMRISSQVGHAAVDGVQPKITTVFFDGSGELLRLSVHDTSAKPVGSNVHGIGPDTDGDITSKVPPVNKPGSSPTPFARATETTRPEPQNKPGQKT